ncbi:hypothetical protein LPTSP3_g23200 [Leptospira kobayashii]|uniref:Uncharacterized protein n=1 Tax=Leptospira kobayashii TaxID=1917830 RepID=A0ABM7UKF9_9LEPT|nr:hypothetical protein [Leptospira kobayashii]BDA79390.1 hypothetical protein LPTSP3_g23200 [Leptospira kobayashii]
MNPFSEIDRFLDLRYPTRRTLCPNRNQVTRFEEIGNQISDLLGNEQDWKHSAEITYKIVDSVVDHFPENIFWDFDYMIMKIVGNSAYSEQGFRQSMDLTVEKILNIFFIFGKNSSIKFRYIHDFIYGYDWLKWMLEKKHPGDEIDPYGVSFLDYIGHRGMEMISLIAKNDSNYPELNGLYRNPFLFSRSDEDEIHLLKDLAASGNIPIEAWDRYANPKSDRNYSKIRLERSEQMGIQRNDMPGSHKT